MNRYTRKLISLVLAVLCLSSFLPARAASYTDVEGHWARNTLLRAAGDGYIVGSGDKLNPNGRVDRAQAAVIINRVLGAKNQADVSAKTDVPPDAWYYGDMARAAYLGYIPADSAAVMTRPLTRQETFIILARAFSLNLACTEQTELSAFSDASALSAGAKTAAASMYKQGLISGSGGKINPNGFLTRAEFLTLIYRITDTYGIVGCAADKAELASGGSAIIRGGDIKTLSAAGACKTVVFAQNSGDLSLGAGADEIIVGTGGGGVSLGGVCRRVDVTGSGRTVNISGGCEEVYITSKSSVSVDYGAAVEKLVILPSAAGCTVKINGTVEELTVQAAGCAVSGGGRVDMGNIERLDCTVSVCPGGYSRINGSAVLTAPETLAAGEKLTVSAKADIADTSVGYTWYTDGARAATGTAEFSPQVKYAAGMAAKMTVGLSLDYAGGGALEHRYSESEIKLQNYPDAYYYAADAQRVIGLVTTYQFQTSVINNGYIYKDSALKTKLCYVKAGTTAMCVSSVGLSAAQIKLSDGTVGWLAYNGIRIASGNCTRVEDYEPADKEIWVNAKKYSSDTDYLVWVSLSCQKVNVFRRSADGWKLACVYSCASGANATPTPTGTYKISYHNTRWDYGSYWCGPITGFYQGYAFHSWLNRSSGGAYDHTMGKPASHGCLRMEDAGAKYMYSLPMGTAVIVF